MNVGKNVIIPILTGVIGSAIGFGAGYQYGIRKNIKAEVGEARREIYADANEMITQEFKRIRAKLGVPEDEETGTEEWVPAVNFEEAVETTATEGETDDEDVSDDEGGESDMKTDIHKRRWEDRPARERTASGTEVVHIDKVEDPVEKARLIARHRELFPEDDIEDDLQEQRIAPFKEGLVFQTEPIVIGNVRDEEREDEPVDRRQYDENGVLAETEPDGWNYSREVRLRTDKAPYVLHADEFFSNEEDLVQCSFMYYPADDVMVDEDDSVVPNYKNIIGELKFGYGSSGDPNVFYVRNPVRKAEYEVLNNPDMSYTEEVLGIHEENEERSDPEIRHSVRKFRPSD
jgi:hypothetical protein